MIAAELENAALARLKAAETTLGYSWRTLDSLPLQFDEALEQLASQAPAAWAVWTGLGQGAVQGTTKAYPTSLVMIVAAENRRSERATRHGGSDAEVGSYQLLADVAALLDEQKLGLDIAPLTLTDARPLFFRGLPKATRNWSVFALTFETTVFMRRGAAASALDDFATFHADWDLPPLGSIDASDHLTLETV